mmetsp:Transcript_15756/g.40044  ORF Transcript_15756/g.40044 Transcript_15756/m.40044 type:complete len:273 (-) Transcript_15756:215-1033(-)
MLLNRVATHVDVRTQVDMHRTVLKRQACLDLGQGQRRWVPLLQHLLVGHDGRSARWRFALGEDPVPLPEMQHVQKGAAIQDPDEAAATLLDHGEGAMTARLQGVHEATHAGPRENCRHARRHDVARLQAQLVLLWAVLQQRDMSKIDVDVVDALVEEVACPLRRHDGQEDRDSPLRLPCGFHEDDGKGDRDARHAREHRGSSDERIQTWAGRHKLEALHQLTHDAAKSCPSQERRHEQAAGNPKPVRPDRLDIVNQGEEQQHTLIDVLLAME